MIKPKSLLVIILTLLCACSKFDIKPSTETGREQVGDLTIHSEFLENESISPEEAMLVAQLSARQFMPSTKSKGCSPQNVFPLITKDGKNLAYAVNYKEGGYSIISATQKYLPVIAFSETGTIDETTLSDNAPFGFYMGLISADIQSITNSYDPQDSLSLRTTAMWNIYKSEVTDANFSNSSEYDQSHMYWYGQERFKAMSSSFTDTANLMSEDLDRYNNLVIQSYGGAPLLGSGDIANYQQENDYLRQNYNKAGYTGTAISSYFWNEFERNTETYNSGDIVKTRWHQHAPYNKFNPDKTNGESGKQPAGCVTIAVSQLLNYHKFPNQLKRLAALHTITMDIDWNLTNIVSLDVTDTNDEIPRLIRFVNQGLRTVNGDSSSSSNIDLAQSFLEMNGYYVEKHNGIDQDEWQIEIRRGYPLYVRGKNASADTGHAFLCTGYKEVSMNVYLELKSTNTFSVDNYLYSPYSIDHSLKGKKVYPSTVYFCFNWGWGHSSTWVIDPITNIKAPNDNIYENIQYLLVEK